MALFRKKGEPIPTGGFKALRKEAQTRASQPPKDTSIFGGKPFLQRPELRERLRKASPFIPGSGGRMIGAKERVGLEKEVFGKKYGPGITPREYSRGLKDLRKAKSKAPTQAERFKIERKIRYLKGLGGK
jgi:hypothetical protein